MKNVIAICISLVAAVVFCACGNTASGLDTTNVTGAADVEGTTDVVTETTGEGGVNNTTASNQPEVSEVRVKITVNGESMYAVLEDNATTRAIVAQMPVTLPMMDLYGREMCYRYGAYALPTENMRSDGYEVGDIAYWAPGGSLVILYEQNGERFERQHIGHIESGVEIFKNTGDVNVTFELAE